MYFYLFAMGVLGISIFYYLNKIIYPPVDEDAVEANAKSKCYLCYKADVLANAINTEAELALYLQACKISMADCVRDFSKAERQRLFQNADVARSRRVHEKSIILLGLCQTYSSYFGQGEHLCLGEYDFKNNFKTDTTSLEAVVYSINDEYGFAEAKKAVVKYATIIDDLQHNLKLKTLADQV